jgi:hypothetical protein
MINNTITRGGVLAIIVLTAAVIGLCAGFLSWVGGARHPSQRDSHRSHHRLGRHHVELRPPRTPLAIFGLPSGGLTRIDHSSIAPPDDSRHDRRTGDSINAFKRRARTHWHERALDRSRGASGMRTATLPQRRKTRLRTPEKHKYPGQRPVTCSVDLTCQHKNHTLLVKGPEITIRPVGTCRVTGGPR